MSSATPFRARVSVFYALRDAAAGAHPTAARSTLHERELPTAWTIGLPDRSLTVERPLGEEYPDPSSMSYSVEQVDVFGWSQVGLPVVIELRVDIGARSLGEVIGAIKDLYDPMVSVKVGGADVVELASSLSSDGHADLGHRSVVVDLSRSDTTALIGDDAAARVAQILCKDTDIGFGLDEMSAVRPLDLNAATGNEVYVWAEQALILRLEPRLRLGWADQMLATVAFMTAAREITEQRVRLIQGLADQAISPHRRLELLVDASAAHELHVQARLEAMHVSLSKPIASFAEAFATQSTVAASADRLRTLIDRTLQVMTLQAQFAERESAERTAAATADVRIIAIVFAVVSVLSNMMALALAVASVPRGADARFREIPVGVAVAGAVTVVSALLALLLVAVARSAANRQRHAGLARLALGSGVVLIAGLATVMVTRTGAGATAGLTMSAFGGLGVAVALAASLRLTPEGARGFDAEPAAVPG